jgi:hypothetical protein
MKTAREQLSGPWHSGILKIAADLFEARDAVSSTDFKCKDDFSPEGGVYVENAVASHRFLFAAALKACSISSIIPANQFNQCRSNSISHHIQP